ncbi:MAG: L,D-transpeptidase [Candidatus Krumholzibacteria bacterium]|nr:L,D-transpeptidase [Candidatus Krumholzibacteria bacterium]
MSPSHKIPPGENLIRLIAQGRDMILARQADFTGRWLLIDVFDQRLILLQDNVINAIWPVSTSTAGLDNRQDSGGTPPGLHNIHEKIGEGIEPGTIFESRQPTDILWRPDGKESGDGDLILTRILTLDGLEEGVNRGPGIDSQARYIYIHGTNHEAAIGSPESGGCVRMTNIDIVKLFDLVEEEDPVVII